MTDVDITIDRDAKTGRFLAGNSGNGGRRPGSRNRLGEQFVSDLRAGWELYGLEAIERVAKEEPGTFLKVIAGLLPRDLNLNVAIDPASFAERFRSAYEMLGNESPKKLSKAKVIDNAG